MHWHLTRAFCVVYLFALRFTARAFTWSWRNCGSRNRKRPGRGLLFSAQAGNHSVVRRTGFTSVQPGLSIKGVGYPMGQYLNTQFPSYWQLESKTSENRFTMSDNINLNDTRLPFLWITIFFFPCVSDDVNSTLTRGERWAQNLSNGAPIALMCCVLAFVEDPVHHDHSAPMTRRCHHLT